MLIPSRCLLFFFSYQSLVSAMQRDESRRILGGTPVKDHELPHQAVLYVNAGKDWSMVCGGSILSQEWILTAAHCCELDDNPQNWLIGLGSTRPWSESEVRLEVSSLHVHEKYLEAYEGYDIALIKTRKSIPYTRAIQPIRIINRNVRPKEKAVVAGLGQVNPPETGTVQFPDSMMKTELKIVDRPRCLKMINKNVLKKRSANPYPAVDQICAIDEIKGSDSCFGDSGGPLVVDGFVAGIVSWGFGCGEKGVPGFYTDVYSHKNWIESHTHSLKSLNTKRTRHQ